MPAPDTALSRRSSTSSLSAAVITELSEFLSLKRDWDALVATSGIDHPFLTHDWIRLWLECFGRHRALRIIVIREEGRIAGIAPMLIDTQRLLGFRMRTLALIWNAHVPRCDFIVSDQRREIYRAIWDQVAAERRSWDLLLLPQLPDGSMLLSEFNDAATADGFLVAVRGSGALPFIPVSGTWKNYIDSLPASLQSATRNRAERLSRMGKVELEQLTTTSGRLSENIEEAFQIEDGGVRGDAGSAAAPFNQDDRAFYAKLAATPDLRDSVRLHYLRSGNKRIAFDLSLQFKNVVYLMKSGCLPEYAEHSPVNILATINLENCFREGVRRYDFVGMEEDWARHWRCSAAPHQWMFVYANSPRTALFHAMKFNPGATIEEWTRLQEAR